MAQAAPYRNPMTNPGRATGPGEDPIRLMVRAAAAKYRLPEALFAALIQSESSFNPKAVSPKGAQGLGQLMPETAKQYGVTDAFDPAQNLDASARYLSDLMTKYGGNLALAVAAYNAGPGAVDRAKGVPNYPETVAFVRKVADLVNKGNGGYPGTGTQTAAAGGGGQAPSGYPTPYQNPMTRPQSLNASEPQSLIPGQRTPPGYPRPFPNAMTRPQDAERPRPRDQMQLLPPLPLKADRRVEEGTVSGLTGMSNQQLDQLVAGDQVEAAKHYTAPDTTEGLYSPPIETRETNTRARANEYGVPDQGYQQPSVAPFYSGGTFPQPEQSGIGSLFRNFGFKGGRSFQDESGVSER